MAKPVVPPFRGRKKMPVSSFGANLWPIETVEQARRAIADVFAFTKGRRQRMFALTVLLNRAAKAGNSEPFVVIDSARQKIILEPKPRVIRPKTIQLSKRAAGYCAKAKYFMRIGRAWDKIDDFFLELPKKIPKGESGAVADYLESAVARFEEKGKRIKDKRKRDQFMGIVSNIYLVIQQLYEKAGLKTKAKKIDNKRMQLERDSQLWN